MGSTDLLHGPHEHTACLSLAVGISFEGGKGRCLVAREDIAAGSLVVDEGAYTVAMKAGTSAILLCHHCQTPLSTDAVTCARCGDKFVNYCDAECRTNAWTVFHRYQCRSDWQLSYAKGDTNTWRMVKLLGKTSVRDLIEFDPAKNDVRQRQGIFGSEKSDVFDSTYGCLMTLMGHRVSSDHLLEYTATSVASILQSGGYFDDDDGQWGDMKRKDRISLVIRTAVYLMPVWRSNNFGMLPMAVIENETHEDEIDRPSVIYIVASLVNHSCWRNVFHIFDGNRIQMRAIRAIAKGEELLTNYGARFGFCEPTAIRREWLRTRFHFECQCRCCSGDDRRMADAERRMLAFRCGTCADPAWPTRFFDADSPRGIDRHQTLIGEPLSTTDWLAYHYYDAQPSDVHVFCVNGHSTRIDGVTVAKLCRVKHGFLEIRRRHDAQDEVDQQLLEELYALATAYLYEASSDMMAIRDIYSAATPERATALASMAEGRRLTRQCFTVESLEYEYELKENIRRCAQFGMHSSDTHLQPLLAEQARLSLRIYGIRYSRHMFRIVVGEKNLHLFDTAVDKINKS